MALSGICGLQFHGQLFIELCIPRQSQVMTGDASAKLKTPTNTRACDTTKVRELTESSGYNEACRRLAKFGKTPTEALYSLPTKNRYRLRKNPALIPVITHVTLLLLIAICFK